MLPSQASDSRIITEYPVRVKTPYPLYPDRWAEDLGLYRAGGSRKSLMGVFAQCMFKGLAMAPQATYRIKN